MLADCRAPCWRDEANPEQPLIRCLPSVFLAGVRKCGTTSLADALRRLYGQGGYARPRCGSSHMEKESQFVDLVSDCALREECAAHRMRSCTHWAHLGNHTLELLTGMFTVNASHCSADMGFVDAGAGGAEPAPIAALYSLAPDRVRVLMVLRHPPSRAWSDYRFEHTVKCKRGQPVVSAHNLRHVCNDTAAKMADRFHEGITKLRRIRPRRVPEWFTYGAYYWKLRRWPMPTLVLRIEDWTQQPGAFERTIRSYLGMPADTPMSTAANSSGDAGSVKRAAADVLQECTSPAAPFTAQDVETARARFAT